MFSTPPTRPLAGPALCAALAALAALVTPAPDLARLALAALAGWLACGVAPRPDPSAERLRRAEEAAEALRRADRRKDEFLATLAHELRNPLAPMRTCVRILKLSADDPDAIEAAAEARDIIGRQVAQMARLIDDLSDVSRVALGRIELRLLPLDLSDVLTEAVEAARPRMDSAGHTLSVVLPPESMPIDGDAARLVQVFNNLLTNAAKYTEPGGTVTLSAGRCDCRVWAEVRDTGIGIAEPDLARVFDLFAQTGSALPHAQGGLGIGLALVAGLVSAHGGTVSATSDGPNRGSAFRVTLPLAERPPA